MDINPNNAQLGPFARGANSDAAKDLWASHLGFKQGTVSTSSGLGGERLPTAPALPKLGGPDDPGRMIKDWNFYKYRPHANMSSSLNRYGPDFRWPGLNNTPKVRHHLAIIKRKPPERELSATAWTDLPRIEPGPGIDYIMKRQDEYDRKQAEHLASFRFHRTYMKQHLADLTAKREALQIRAFTEPSPWST